MTTLLRHPTATGVGTGRPRRIALRRAIHSQVVGLRRMSVFRFAATPLGEKCFTMSGRLPPTSSTRRCGVSRRSLPPRTKACATSVKESRSRSLASQQIPAMVNRQRLGSIFILPRMSRVSETHPPARRLSRLFTLIRRLKLLIRQVRS